LPILLMVRIITLIEKLSAGKYFETSTTLFGIHHCSFFNLHIRLYSRTGERVLG